MSNELTITGEVIEIGYLGDNVGDGTDYGLSIKTAGGEKITISGLSADQCRGIKGLALEQATITVNGAGDSDDGLGVKA